MESRPKPDRIPSDRLLDALPVAVFVVRGGRFLYLNARAAAFFGADTAAPLLDRPIVERLFPADREAWRVGVERLLESGSPVPAMALRWQRLDGSAVAANASAIRYEEADAAQLCIALSGIDAACGDATVGTCEPAEARDSDAIWHWETDARHRFRFLSEAFFRRLKLMPEDILGKTRHEVASVQDGNTYWDTHLAALDRREPFRDQRTTMRDGGGNWRYISVDGDPVIDDRGQFAGYRGVAREITAAFEAAAAAQTAAARIFDAIENLPVGIGIFDSDERMVVSNAPFIVMPDKVSDLVRPGTRYEDILTAAAERGAFHASMGRKEAVLARRCQEFRSAASSSDIRFSDGRWRRILSYEMRNGGRVVLLLDTSEAKANEARLLQAGQILRNVTGNLPGWISRWTKSSEGTVRVEYAVGALRTAFALPQVLEPIEGLDVLENFVDGDAAQRIRQASETAARDLAPFQVEFSLVDRDGRQRWLQSNVNVSRLGDGSVAWDCMVLDITAQRELKEGLIASERRFSMLAEGSRQAILVHRDNRILYANPAAAALFGYERCEDLIAGAEYLDLLPESAHRLAGRNAAARSASTGLATDDDVRTRTRDGRQIWLNKRTFALEWDGALAVCTTLYDITEAREADEQARRHLEALAQVQRMQMMGELATGIAHEIGQPLLNIKNYAEGALKRLESGKVQEGLLRGAFEHISRQASLAGEIVRNVRGFVKPDRVHSTRVDLAATLEDVVRLLEAEARLAGVSIEFDDASSMPTVHGSKIGLEQVFLNILRNALDAIRLKPDTPGYIRIRSWRSDGGVKVAISDNGPGLPKRLADRIFEAFYTTKADGIGLGLSICRSIVESAGGRIDVASDAGKGATFTVTLRTDDGEHQGATRGKRPKHNAALAAANIAND